ncbi:MAG: TonB-dependent receptor plug domain-containing protein [Balneolaceae bacterium]
MTQRSLRSVLFFLVIFSLSLIAATPLMAQEGTLDGQLLDARTGQPLPGVTLYIPELDRGTASDVDGQFSIDRLPYGEYTLRLSSVGYQTRHLPLPIHDEQVSLTLDLEEDLVGLGELIVTGQGQGLERYRLSTNVTAITGNEIDRLPTLRLDQILQSNLSNAQVRFTSGEPGTASLIRGRGVVSALTATTPVVYIDGVRVDQTTGFNLYQGTGGSQSSALADIPVENIERIEVVSGGAATTLYGSDAANGVIQIFTKHGTSGASRFELETVLGQTHGTRDYLRYDETGDILFTPGIVQQYRLSGSGGSDQVQYSFSGSMSGDEGVLPNNDQVRHSLRTSLQARVRENVHYRGSFAFASHEFSRDWNGNSSGSPLDVDKALFGNPESWDDSDYQARKEYILGYLAESDMSEDVKRYQTSQQLEVEILPELTARVVAGVDARQSGQFLYDTNAAQIAYGFEPPGTTDSGRLSEASRNFLGLTLEGTLRHETDWRRWNLISQAGGQVFRNDERQVRITAEGVPDGSRLAGSGSSTSGSNFRRTLINYGGYWLENLGYDNRYFLELAMRVDQNSAFGETIPAQLYPKVGTVWNLAGEPALRDAFESIRVSTLRLRGNLGWAGNFPTPFSNEVLASIRPFLDGQAIEFGTAGDEALRPERTRTLEAGLDLGVFRDRVILEASWYRSETEDALFRAPFPPSSGLGSALQNVGTIENHGIELATRINVLRTRDANVGIRGSLNTLHNQVTDNGGTSPFAIGGFGFLGSWVDEGHSVGHFRGNRPEYGAGGSIQDVQFDVPLGSPLPDYFGSLGVTADWRSWSLVASADYQLGAQGINMDEILRYINGAQDGRIPDQAVQDSGGNYTIFSSEWVEDTDYLKVRLLSIGYEFPESWLAGGFRSLSLAFTASHPFNWTRSKFDPEVSGQGVARGQGEIGVGGFGLGTLSSPRQYTFRIRAGF